MSKRQRTIFRWEHHEMMINDQWHFYIYKLSVESEVVENIIYIYIYTVCIYIYIYIYITELLNYWNKWTFPRHSNLENVVEKFIYFSNSTQFVKLVY